MIKSCVMYLHGDKSSNIEAGVREGLTEKALETFAYALYEVQLTCDVDTETGECRITHVDGRKLMK